MNKTDRNAHDIAARINAAGETDYHGEHARAWTPDSGAFGRIYFGRQFVTIEPNGEIHNHKRGKTRATTSDYTTVEMVERYA